MILLDKILFQQPFIYNRAIKKGQKMNFYTSISTYYDHIFPFSPAQLEMTALTLQGNPGAKILDIGCATGSLALTLAERGFMVEAIDYDEAMIASAEKKADRTDNLRFSYMDMLKIAEEYNAETFDAALCFGNTLVHLTRRSDIEKFFAGLAAVIKPGGLLLLQILNYDYILDEGVTKLPPIGNKIISFKRSYSPRDDGLIDFNTELTIAETGTMVSNSIPLLPLRKTELSEMMTAAGFRDLEFFGDFKMNPLTKTSLPLVVRGRKIT